MIKHRKGRVPHIVVITAEPLPSRLASIAGGMGQLDCVYHFALLELQNAVANLIVAVPSNKGLLQQAAQLEQLVGGNRLKDIADLPFDLMI
jgi:hypothetical protein